MKFEVEGELITLKGDPTLVKSRVSLKSMLRMLKKKEMGYWVECSSLESSRAQDTQLLANTTIPAFLATTISQHTQVFAEPTGLPPVRNHEHAICLKQGSNPVGVRPYRYPQSQKDEIERLITEMLAAGIIKPSTSPFSSPVLLVKKKDGSWRFCVDYRALNKETVADKFPIPVIDELLDELHGARIFSKLDLKSGYHQILVKPEDTHKTAFRTHDGHYEFLVMPFGLMNAPATFQSLMNDVFRPCLRRFVLVFFDDILVYSKTELEHTEHMQVALGLLAEHSLFANLKKCEFGKSKVGYLGHVISAQGVGVDQDKVQAVVEWPVPQNLRDLRGFLGLTGYYRKFVAKYAQIAQPLTDQLRKDNFGWSEAADTAFSTLKAAMVSAPVMVLPDFKQTFVLESDASGYGIGAVLMQQGRPIAYFSKLLGSRAQQKSIYEKELIAICLAVQKWRHYLMGRHFVIRTDQQSLRFITQQREVNADYQKWVTKLLGFDFEVQYKPGASNRVADALSRKQVGEVTLQNLVCNTLLTTHGVQWTKLDQEGTDLKRSTSYHPQTDGQTEIVNKGLETYLRCFVGDKPRTWAQWLSWAEYSYNTSPHCSTKLSPFKVLYGRDPPHLMRVGRGQTFVDSLDELLQERDAMLAELHYNLMKAQQVMKRAADAKRRDEEFAVGDSVYLKLQPYRQRSLARRPFEKLSPRFYGPFTVLQRIGKVAYKLDLPQDSRIHSVFHVSQLKKSVGLAQVSPTLPPQLNAEMELVVEPEEVLEVRQVQVGQNSQLEALIKWKTLPAYEATWEEVALVAHQFPHFHLEDKVNLWAGGNVMTPGPVKELIKYARRQNKDRKDISSKEVNNSGQGVKQ
ncbi:hypothetical protein DCAR_0727466 [Daucus carota subsp. sativus]|uniref:Chromo domain-containing protein n=1 Tax=Daucus carota subsp. sativus TaxID=79200 RepID=A0AAF1B6H7_DAUCS|nr:hypothetical protein DCAR_0727466 [Daucus carota subsp. sativus]